MNKPQVTLLARYEMMRDALATMPEKDRGDLNQWERLNLDGHSVGTSDWPGWERYIGQVPEAARVKPARKKQPIPQHIRWIVWERDDFTCQMCGSRYKLSIDHIIPESKGGATELENLRTLCCTCNSRKGNR